MTASIETHNIPRETARADGKALMRRFYDEVLMGGEIAATEIFAPDFTDHIPHPLPGVQPATGPEAATWFVRQLRTAFPDVTIEIDDLIAEGDRVAARVTWRGTHRGSFLTVDPTGKKIQVTGIDIVRIEDAKIAEHWGEIDILTMMLQLGFLPTGDESTA